MKKYYLLSVLIMLGCAEPPPTVSGVPKGDMGRVEGALVVGGCECKTWQPGVKCEELSYSDIPTDNKYYVTTFGGPGDGQDMWICGYKTTDNGSWPYAAGYARFGCGKIKVINPDTGKSCIAEVADCGPNRCVEEAACFCDCQGKHPVLDVSPFITQYLFGISSSGWSEKRVVIAYPVDPATPIGCPGGPEPTPDLDQDGHAMDVDCRDYDPEVHPGAAERCNSIDDDCDNLTDEDFAGICSVGVGECRRSGRWRCMGNDVVCDAVPAEPKEEVCDGLDNDCDGETDEDYASALGVCSMGIGDCQVFSFWICAPDGAGLRCPAVPGEPTEEICDARDNDCDGVVDEGVCIACTPGETRPCTKLDSTPGVRTCGPDGLFGPCMDEEGLAEPDARAGGERDSGSNKVDSWDQGSTSLPRTGRGGCSAHLPSAATFLVFVLALILRRVSI